MRVSKAVMLTHLRPQITNFNGDVTNTIIIIIITIIIINNTLLLLGILLSTLTLNKLERMQ
jgi:hypothetical protein